VTQAHADAPSLTRRRSLPAWLLGLVPLMLAVGVLGAFAVLGGPGLGDRPGPAVEELSVERTVLAPGSIKLTVRNDGPDRVTLAQAFVNDAYVDFEVAHTAVDRLRAETVRIAYPWIEGEAYEVGLLTSTGATFTHEIAAAVQTPSADLGFFGLMALLGIYVGVIPVALGMLWLPFVRRVDATWIRVLLAATVGLLGFLAVDATLEALEIAGQGPQALGGAGLVALGAGLAYLALAAVSARVSERHSDADAAGASPQRLAGLVALGIGLHNLGEGLAIGSAYATGALALGAFLVVGFAIHNTTEGLAIVAPLGRSGVRASVGRLALLGLLAGGPAVLGAWIGAAAFTPSLAAFLLGVGVGAIAQVIVQIAPGLRDAGGRILDRAVAGGIAGGMLVMYATGLLVSA
jgi:ZIP family zinc transporter